MPDDPPRAAPGPFRRVTETAYQHGALTVAELAQHCDLDVAVVERVIARLVARGLVEERKP